MSESNDIFPGLIGGDRAKKLIGATLRQNHLLHNYIFEGPLGIGKFPFAVAFARSIICSNPQNGIACRQCDNCRLFDKGHHPDALIMSRDAELSVDEAREINNIVMRTPQRSDRRVVILDGIDRMNPHAGNALLKTFEEAPGGTIFILTTHRVEKLLPTILSRSLRVPFFLLPTDRLADDFARTLNLDTKTAQRAAELASGRPGWGIRFILHPKFRELHEYGQSIFKDSMLGKPLTDIFHIESLIENFMRECAEMFTDQEKISGMDCEMIARRLDGETVNFKPVNFLLELKKKGKKKEGRKEPERNLNALGFILLGGIFRNMIAKGDLQNNPARYIPYMKALLEAPRLIEKNFNKNLVIERFILSSCNKFGV
ncbi:DNA polymerase III subunit [bacterium]|nr:DNA polymerase III subunit [bacterium]